MWAEIYDKKLTATNIFSMQSDLARQIAKKLHAELAPEEKERIDSQPTRSLAAYDLEVRGRYLLERGDVPHIPERAVAMFERAIAEDATYAPAWAGLSRALHQLMLWMYVSEEESIPRAKAAAERALSLDEKLAAAHVALGAVLRTEREYGAAEESFQRAIELSPSAADAHASYGELLRDRGRLEEALRRTRRALELDPMSIRKRVLLAHSLYFSRDFAAALLVCHRILELDPENPDAFYWRGFSQIMRGEIEAGVASVERARDLNPLNPYYAAAVAIAYAFAGDADAARAILTGSKIELPHVEIGLTLGQLGDLDGAFRSLERAYTETPAALFYLEFDPAAESLRSDSRWDPFVAKLHAK
jgi:tetratricopeptide (TPR) repeat protein